MAAVLSGCAGNHGPAHSGGATAPLVVTAKATAKTVPVDLHAVGNVEALSTITVKARIGGELTKVFFREGDTVRKGDPLFLIDPRPYQDAVRQAEANLEKDSAMLRQAEANLQRDITQEKYAREQSARYRQLFTEGVMSKQQADQYGTDADVRAEAVRADRAAIESARAALLADKVALETARLQLSYCSINSPIDGRTGDLKVKQGNLVKATDVDLVTINQIHPILVAFSVPEKDLAAVKEHGKAGKLPVLASPPGAPEQIETGVLTFIDNAVDATTGTIKLKGTFQNPGGRLWPGQFVNVVLRLETIPNAVVIPSRAVQQGQTGDFVYVVKPDGTVEARPVFTGVRAGQELVVEKGLADGETVVTEGQLKLAPGMKIRTQDERGS